MKKLAFALALGVSLTGACAGTTGSKRFPFDARIGGAVSAAGPLTFTNQRDWTITLTKANVTLGPVYLNVVAPLGAQTWLEPFLVSSAHALGESHLESGRIVGEVLAQVSFDALSPVLVGFPARGTMVADRVRTAEICFFPPPGTPIDRMNIDTVAFDVSGQAVRGAETVRFRGQLTMDAAWLPDSVAGQPTTKTIVDIRTVRGINTSFMPTEAGALEIRFDVRALFRGADFSNLSASPEDPDGTKVLVQSKSGTNTTDQVMRNVFNGLIATTGTYTVRWAP